MREQLIAGRRLEFVEHRGGFGVAAPDSGSEGQINWVCTVTNVSNGLDRVEITASWNSAQGPESLTVADLVSTR